MHILIATDGTLNPDQTADAVARWYKDGDSVTVFTAMNIPSDFLRRLGEGGVAAAASIALEAGQGFTSGDRAAERMAHPRNLQTGPRGDSPVMRALSTTALSRIDPVVAALKARDVPATASWATTENKTARSVLAAVAKHDSGLLVIGSHGHGRFEGLLGSTGTKLVRQAPTAVLVIRETVIPQEDD